jgi:hypothetical protein
MHIECKKDSNILLCHAAVPMVLDLGLHGPYSLSEKWKHSHVPVLVLHGQIPFTSLL